MGLQRSLYFADALVHLLLYLVIPKPEDEVALHPQPRVYEPVAFPVLFDMCVPIPLRKFFLQLVPIAAMPK